jgi:hypothetical protein
MLAQHACSEIPVGSSAHPQGTTALRSLSRLLCIYFVYSMTYYYIDVSISFLTWFQVIPRTVYLKFYGYNVLNGSVGFIIGGGSDQF